MTFNEIGSGGLLVAGCVVPKLRHRVFSRFGVGDVAYSLPGAHRGILEKVVVKRVRAVWSYRNTVVYEDTLNGLWNEDELVTYEDAVIAAELALLARYAQLEELKKC